MPSVSGILFYNSASSSAPSAPTLSNFNTSTGTFGSITANWAPTFTATAPSTNVSTEEGNKFWAVRYNVYEDSGGTQTITQSAVFNWQNQDGLATFANVKTAQATPFIDGGNTKDNTMGLDRIAAGTTGTFGSCSIGFGTAVTLNSIVSGFTLFESNFNEFGVVVGNTAGGTALAAGTTAVGTDNYASIAAIGAASSNWSLWKTSAILSTGSTGGYFGNGGSSNMQSAIAAEIRLGYNNYAVYVTAGTAGPFTAGHDGLQKLSDPEPQAGDLMVDVQVIAAPTVSDAIAEMTVSSAANQAGVVGVFTRTAAMDFVPAALTNKNISTADGLARSNQLKPEFANIYDTHRPIAVNSIGEGKINVCGQNGDIAIGSLIVASDMPGKGMRQADDIVKNYTVAKAREAVTFDSPNEVKQIACIYMCG